MSSKSYEEHSFFCLACGQRGIPIQRKQGFKHKDNHRKKLYCIHCKQEVNHIECKTFEDIEEFYKNFENGVYKDEGQNSLSFIRSASFR